MQGTEQSQKNLAIAIRGSTRTALRHTPPHAAAAPRLLRCKSRRSEQEEEEEEGGDRGGSPPVSLPFPPLAHMRLKTEFEAGPLKEGGGGGSNRGESAGLISVPHSSSGWPEPPAPPPRGTN